jgi:CRISPR/Cas system-associated protein Cas5 (RAMP superfamily)
LDLTLYVPATGVGDTECRVSSIDVEITDNSTCTALLPARSVASTVSVPVAETVPVQVVDETFDPIAGVGVQVKLLVDVPPNVTRCNTIRISVTTNDASVIVAVSRKWSG